MSNAKKWTWREVAIGVTAFGGLLMSPLGASAAEPVANPTFTKDIAPIFQAKCEACHRPDSIAPMSLVTYEQSRPYSRAIKDRVAARQMPPWNIDKTVGIQKFKNDRSLSDQELETIVKWVDAGSPMGNPKDMPAAVKWPDDQGWNFAAMFGQTEPDLIIRSTPYLQKAGAQDAWWRPVVASGVTEPRWVRAIEIRPATVKGRKVVHHAIARLQQNEALAPSNVRDPDAADPDAVAANAAAGGGTFMEWAVGKQGEIMRPNSGKLILPGSKFTWDIHYSNGGEDVTSVVEMGIYFYPKGQEPKYRQVLHLMGATNAGGVDIPPNTVNSTEGFFVLKENARVESFQPHMHLRGKAMQMSAILPTGQVQVLSYVSNFNFNWMSSYLYADDAAPMLPKGTILKVEAWHDNTASNKNNPDPNVWVGYGDRTVDEMAHAWVNVTYMNDKDYADELAARRERKRSTQQQ
jgi:hypothetical protein